MSFRCSRYNLVDLVDGRLSPIATEQVHAHVASCSQCRSAVIAYREVSARLRSVRPADPAPDFLLRLSMIPIAQHASTAPRHSTPAQSPTTVVSLADHRQRSVRSQSAKTGITAISAAGLLCVAAFVGVSESQVAVSVPRAPAVSVAPMISTFSQVHLQTAQSNPFANATYVDVSYPTASQRSSHLVP